MSGARNSTVVRVLDEPDDQHDSIIVGRVPTTSELISGDRASVRGAIRALDATDVAIVQHEYGIYGGRDEKRSSSSCERLKPQQSSCCIRCWPRPPRISARCSKRCVAWPPSSS